jgi:WD40 repeat protein
VRYPVLEISSRCKLSCASYNSYIQHRLAVSDFEGTVQVRDTQHNVDVAFFDEHSDRVWSIHCAPLDPGRLVTASMDATVKIWDTSAEASVATIVCGAQVCACLLLILVRVEEPGVQPLCTETRGFSSHSGLIDDVCL